MGGVVLVDGQRQLVLAGARIGVDRPEERPREEDVAGGVDGELDRIVVFVGAANSSCPHHVARGAVLDDEEIGAGFPAVLARGSQQRGAGARVDVNLVPERTCDVDVARRVRGEARRVVIDPISVRHERSGELVRPQQVSRRIELRHVSVGVVATGGVAGCGHHGGSRPGIEVDRAGEASGGDDVPRGVDADPDGIVRFCASERCDGKRSRVRRPRRRHHHHRRGERNRGRCSRPPVQEGGEVGPRSAVKPGDACGDRRIHSGTLAVSP